MFELRTEFLSSLFSASKRRTGVTVVKKVGWFRKKADLLFRYSYYVTVSSVNDSFVRERYVFLVTIHCIVDAALNTYLCTQTTLMIFLPLLFSSKILVEESASGKLSVTQINGMTFLSFTSFLIYQHCIYISTLNFIIEIQEMN